MRYLGGKALMVDNIVDMVRTQTTGVRTVADLFAGTGIVSRHLKSYGYVVYSNDILYFSYALNRGLMEMEAPVSAKMAELVDYLNALTPETASWFNIGSAFVYQNFSPHEGCERQFFQSDNALKIDLVRQAIERMRSELDETSYFYLLALLLDAATKVSNISGIYAAYLKDWDKRTHKPLTLTLLPATPGSSECRCFNLDAIQMAQQTVCDLAYLDPPYNARQYLPNYHVLETIALYDYPVISGKAGQRTEPSKMSDFCRKQKVEQAFCTLLNSLQSRYVLLSYNNEGLLTTEQLTQLMCQAGLPETFKLYEYDARRYKNKIPNNRAGLKEQLYFIQKDL